MAVSDADITKITIRTVKSSFFSYFACREQPNTKHILLSKLFPEESAIRSAIGGLETSLGTTLWERIATQIALANGFTVLNPKTDFLQPKKMPTSITNLIAKHKDAREVEDADIPMSVYVKELHEAITTLKLNELPTTFKTLTKGSGVDIFLIKGNQEYVFDIKTVQINAGSGTKFNETLMKWIAFRRLYLKHINKNYCLNAHIVIPYDPHENSDWWTEFGDRAYPLDKKDVLLGNNFWDLLSGRSNTLEVITKAFESLVRDNFQSFYVEFLHGSGINQSLKLLKNIGNISLLDTKNPETLTTKCKWRCNKCGKDFEKSVKATVNAKKCPKCDEQFID
jgi:predicted Zn-ribbon and HTH transcriptional regulator